MNAITPENTAGIWSRLEAMASRIGDSETRSRYLADWRGRYEEAFPPWLGDGSIISLPDWSHVGQISARERRQATMVSEAWLAEQAIDVDDSDAVKRLCWEYGRRVAAGLIEKNSADAAMVDHLGARATAKDAIGAFRRGLRSSAGEGLLASIVLDLRCARHPRTDKGNARRFRDRHGHNFRHTTAKGWLKWDGKRWRVLDEERGIIPAEILDAIFDTVDAIQREASAMRATGLSESSVPEHVDADKFKVEVDGVKRALSHIDVDDDGADSLVITASTCRLLSETLARFGRSSEEARRMKCIADLARRWLTVKIQDFDTDPLTINCQNGTLRLVRTVERGGTVKAEVVMSAHAREDLLTKIADVDYDPGATCPNYDFTINWAQPKDAMRRYLHQWGGYNLTGDMGAQIFHIWWGPLAQNGKSTILDAWASCAGDYADAGKIETFMEAAHSKGGDAATPALARLPGVRMLRTGEPPANAKFDESLINQITGQDTLQIRDNFRSFFAVLLQIKVTVACNQPPAIPNATEGIKRRVKVVPFEKTMKGALRPDGKPLRDENFKEKLVPEKPGIFARLIEGALDWLAHGFVEPEDVTQWTDEYKDENDPLGRFLSYCTEVDPESRVQASHLHALFEAWAKATGGPDWKIGYLKKKMIGKGFSSKASNGMQWLGLKKIKEVSDFVDADGHVLDLSRGDAAGGGAQSAKANSDDPPRPPDDRPDPDADLDDYFNS